MRARDSATTQPALGKAARPYQPRLEQVTTAPHPSAMFRGNSQRTGRTPYRLPQHAPAIRWRFGSKAAIYATPAIDRDGNVYVASLDGSAFSLTATGKLRWRTELHTELFASPTLVKDGVLFGGDDEVVRLLDRRSGKPLWSFELGPCPQLPGQGMDRVLCDADSPAAIHDNEVYCGGDAIYAFSSKGQLRWRVPLPAHAMAGPTLTPQGLLAIGTQAGVIVAVNRANGQPAWQFPTRADCDSTAAAAQGRLYIGCDNGRFYALTASTGQLQWEMQAGAPIRSSPAIDRHGRIYVGSYDGRLYALSTAGAVLWSYDTGAAIHSSPVVDPHATVVFGSRNDHLYAINGGYMLWRVRLGGDIDSSVAVAPDGTLYVGCDDGDLYALR